MERVRGKKPVVTGTVLAYLTAHRTKDGWRKIPTQRDYHDGAAARADELGYRLEEFWLGEQGMSEARLSGILRSRGIEGVIIAPLESPGALYRKFHWKHFSVVELGYSLRGIVLHRCCNQQFQSMMLLLERLRAAGYLRMGLAMGPGQDERVNHHWRAAYLAMQSLIPDVSVTSLPFFFGEEDTWTRSQFGDWLISAKPEVVVTVGSDVREWIVELGLRVPEDVALANVDLSETMADVTGINQNALQVGAASVDLLLSQMRTGERGLPDVPRTLMVDGAFVQGKTTREPMLRANRRQRCEVKAGD